MSDSKATGEGPSSLSTHAIDSLYKENQRLRERVGELEADLKSKIQLCDALKAALTNARSALDYEAIRDALVGRMKRESGGSNA